MLKLELLSMPEESALMDKGLLRDHGVVNTVPLGNEALFLGGET